MLFLMRFPKNQEIIMLVAESVKIAQEVTERAIKAREEKQ